MGEVVCAVFVDLQKSFVTINHEKLKEKLNHYRIKSKQNNWFQSFLTNSIVIRNREIVRTIIDCFICYIRIRIISASVSEAVQKSKEQANI